MNVARCKCFVDSVHGLGTKVSTSFLKVLRQDDIELEKFN